MYSARHSQEMYRLHYTIHSTRPQEKQLRHMYQKALGLMTLKVFVADTKADDTYFSRLYYRVNRGIRNQRIYYNAIRLIGRRIRI